MDRKVEGTQKGLSDTDRGEASAADSRRDMVDAQVGISSGSSNNSVVDDLHRDMTGNRGTVGGTADNILIVSRREGLQRVGVREVCMVDPRGEGKSD